MGGLYVFSLPSLRSRPEQGDRGGYDHESFIRHAAVCGGERVVRQRERRREQDRPADIVWLFEAHTERVHDESDHKEDRIPAVPRKDTEHAHQRGIEDRHGYRRVIFLILIIIRDISQDAGDVEHQSGIRSEKKEMQTEDTAHAALDQEQFFRVLHLERDKPEDDGENAERLTDYESNIHYVSSRYSGGRAAALQRIL